MSVTNPSRLPALTPSRQLAARCPKQASPFDPDRCLAPSVDGSRMCRGHAERVHRLAHCTFVVEHDDGGLVACGLLTVALHSPVRCTEHAPKRDLSAFRPVGIDSRGAA